MTPKEKALELFNKFIPILGGINSTDWIYFNGKEAKQCAIIAVDEILDALVSERISYGGEYRYEESDYWEEVKTEIEKL
jgi:hypothetical protein